MNSIYKNIQFESELCEDFKDDKLPTLDFKIWAEKGANEDIPEGMVLYSYFEKEMTSPYCIMERTAMAENSKIASLSQDLIRRMTNTSEMVPQEVRDEIVEKYVSKLTVSGYNKDQVRRIVEAGLKGYQTKLVKCAKNGTKLHRSAKSTLAGRQKKKLLEKITWFRNNMDKEDGSDSDKDNTRTIYKKNKTSVKKNSPDKKLEILTVLFVPRTPGGELAARLRSAENEISKITGDLVKIVESAGTKMKSQLHKSNPWAGSLCDRDDCLVCKNNGEKQGDCKRRNVVYKTTCRRCQEKGVAKSYYGESARTA